MEDTLREIQKPIKVENQVAVLILVLMEDTLRAIIGFESMEEARVLILVLMEDTLRG